MSKYNTRQRTILLAYLSSHTDEPLSVPQIAEALSDQLISPSAIYRNLSELEREGKIRCCRQQGSRQAFYQYMDADSCKGHLHLSCIGCGKTIHLTHASTHLLRQQIAKYDGFTVDNSKTILYGLCSTCTH